MAILASKQLKDTHTQFIHFSRNPQAQLDIQQIREQGERFLKIEQDLDRVHSTESSCYKNWRVDAIAERWRKECGVLYHLNTFLPEIFNDISRGEQSVLASAGQIREEYLNIQDVDYIDDHLKAKTKIASSHFHADIFTVKKEVIATATRIGQKLNLPLEIAPFPGPRELTYTGLFCDCLILTAKKTASYIYRHPYFALRCFCAAAAAIVIKRLF